MLRHSPSTSRAASWGLLLVLGVPAVAGAQRGVVAPQGALAEIDTRLARETMRALQEGGADEKAKAVDAILASPDRFAPPVLYLLSNVLFERGDMDEAAFWFYAGQLRARVDANRCVDPTARQAVSVLNNEYGPPINRYAFKDIPKLEALIPRVVEWDKTTPRNYDHRWINLHGMDAILSTSGPPGPDASLSLPPEQWERIDDTTRADYLDGFRKAMAQIKAMKK